MPCYHPLHGFWDGRGGRWSARAGVQGDVPLSVPCGQCIGCRLERSRQHGVRCMHESKMHDESSFITLTYSPEFLPANGSLVYRDWQLFAKRLRFACGPFRFFMCGEYGERTYRPHFHACVFGLGFPDRYYWRMSDSGFKLFRSPLLENLWKQGSAEVGDVSFESAAYVARYCLKKVTGDKAKAHYERVDLVTGEIINLTPEFCHASNGGGRAATWKGGIGKGFFDKYKSDMYPHDRVVVRGVEAKPPRYYDKQLSAEELEWIKKCRLEKALLRADDNTVDRLRVRETCTRARLEFKVRPLE